jgi:hypothetical protein
MKNKQDQVRQYFTDRGCILLDDYTHCMTKMKWLCPQGHENFTCWNNFSNISRSRTASKCATCSKVKKLTFEQVAREFKEGGCELLDKTYENSKKALRFICSCGKESTITIFSFRRGCRCVQCGIRRNDTHWNWRPDRESFERDRLFRKKLYKALRTTFHRMGEIKRSHAPELLGYGPIELREHVERHENWDLVKDTDWQLDHIFPIKAFLDHGIRDVKLINSLSNLQPMTREDNRKKWDTYNKDHFFKWLETINSVEH